MCQSVSLERLDVVRLQKTRKKSSACRLLPVFKTRGEAGGFVYNPHPPESPENPLQNGGRVLFTGHVVHLLMLSLTCFRWDDKVSLHETQVLNFEIVDVD